MNQQSPNHLGNSNNRFVPQGQNNQMNMMDHNRSPVLDYYVVPQHAQTMDNRPSQLKFDQLQMVSQQLSSQRMQSAANETPMHAQTTPFNQKYLISNNNSTTSGGKPIDSQRMSKGQHISKFQVYNNQANIADNYNNDSEPGTMQNGPNNQPADSAFQNYYQAAQQRTPNTKAVNQGRNSFQNASSGGASGSGGRHLSSSSARKSQLHENDLDDLKSTLAQVQNRLPETIQTRLSSEKKASAKKQQEVVQAPGTGEQQRQLKQSQKELLKNLLNGAYKPALGDQSEARQLPAPGNDRLWRTEPLDRLAARKKAQKVFVPKKPRNSASKQLAQDEQPALAQDVATQPKLLDAPVLQEFKTDPKNETKNQEKAEEEEEWTPQNVVSKKKELEDDDRSRTQQYKLRNMNLNNQSSSLSPKVNKSQNINDNRRRPRVESIGIAPPDKQPGPASTIEFEAKHNESSFSSDSDFDRNMDEMQSDALNEQQNRPTEVKNDLKPLKSNIITEIIKEEKYEESNTIGPSKSPLKNNQEDAVNKQQQQEFVRLETEFKTQKGGTSPKDYSRASQSQMNNVKSLEKYIADLQRQKNIFSDQEFDPKKLTEILQKNDELQKQQAERDKLMEQIQKSLNLRNELLIKYRIESEEYTEQMNQFKSLEKQAQQSTEKKKPKTQRKQNLLEQTPDNSSKKRGRKKLKSKSSRNRSDQTQSQKENNSQMKTKEYFPDQEKTKATVNDFLYRQRLHDLGKKKWLEKETKRKQDRESQDLPFRPNTKGKRSASKASLQPVRSIDDFLKDQERYKNKLQSKIESARRQKAEEEQNVRKQAKGMSKKSKKILVDASNKKKRNSIQMASLKLQLTSSRSKKEDSSWSDDHDSMDEGLIVKYIDENRGNNCNSSMRANSIDDVDEHPKQQSQVQKQSFVNKFGFNVEIVHTENFDTADQAPLLQNKIGGVQITKNPLTSSKYQSTQVDEHRGQQINMPLGGFRKPQIANIIIPQKLSSHDVAGLNTQRYARPQFFDSVSSSQHLQPMVPSDDGFVLKNQMINQAMQKEQMKSSVIVKSSSIKSINDSSKMKTNLGQNNAMTSYYPNDFTQTIPKSHMMASSFATAIRSMSNLNVNARGSFENTASNHVVRPNDQNSIRKVLRNDDEDDIFDDDFSSSDADEGQTPVKQTKLKLKDKRHGSVKSISYRSSSNSQNNRMTRMRASTNSANKLNRAASQNLYYKRENNSSKKKQAISFQNQFYTTSHDSNSGSIEIPPCRKETKNNRLEMDLLNSMRNSSSLNELVRSNNKEHKKFQKHINSYSHTKLIQSQPDSLFSKQKLSSQTEKVVLKKFNKEFMSAVQTVTQQQTIPMKIDCYQFVMMLVQLGAIKQRDIENRHSSEYKKVEEMWIALLKSSQHPLHGRDSKEEDKIYIGDAKLLLIAAFGLKGNKRLDADDRGAMVKQRAQFFNNQLPFGWLAKSIDPEGFDDDLEEKAYQLFLTPKCVKTVRQQFNLLYMNRINSIGQNIEVKKKQKADQEIKDMKFKPYLLTEKMNEKLLQIAHRKPSRDRSLENKVPLLRARSVSKDYKRYYDSQNNWREKQLKIKEIKEMENCTFKPNIQKSTRKYKNSSSTYFSTNLSSMAQMPTNTSPSNQEQKAQTAVGGLKASQDVPIGKDGSGPPQKNEEKSQQSSIQQKLQSMERFEQLYQVGKAHFQAKKILANLPSDQREYEKQKDECTFKPAKISKEPPKKKVVEVREASPSKAAIQGIFKDYKHNELLNKIKMEEVTSKEQDVKQEPKQRMKDLLEKSQQQAIQRQQQANKDREYIKQCKNEGKAARMIQNRGKSPSEALTPQEAEIKIKSVTDRLTLVKKSQQAQKKPEKQFKMQPPRRRPTPTNDQQKTPQPQAQAGLPFRQNHHFEPVLKNQKQKDALLKDEAPNGSQRKDQMPMMYVDVFIDSEGEPIKHRIPVYRGDHPAKLAEEFCIKHGYDLDTQDNLEQSLSQKIGEVVSKLGTGPNQLDNQFLQPANRDMFNQKAFDRNAYGQLERKMMQINELNQDLEKIEEEEPQIIQDDLEAGGDQSLLDDQL